MVVSKRSHKVTVSRQSRSKALENKRIGVAFGAHKNDVGDDQLP
jgi:hypothetical protein